MSIKYGLIGYPLSHSFSGKYFAEKFRNENIKDTSYELFEIPNISAVKDVFKIENLSGFNITIPYKQSIKKYLDEFDISAVKVGAVNVVKITKEGRRIGYNSDYYGFKKSITDWIKVDLNTLRALVLGTGGASKAVKAVFNDIGIETLMVSRSDKGDLTYDDLLHQNDIIETHKLIINTTPLGMSPNIAACPSLPYEKISQDHHLYDLIYNPEETRFLKHGKVRGAHVKNGYEMLVLQAEKSWEIWND